MELVRTYHVESTTMALLQVGLSLIHSVPLMIRTLITLCPSPSTTRMLESHSLQNVRLWPRGVDLAQFGPSKRSAKLRASWGVGDAPRSVAKHQTLDTGLHWQGRKASMPLTPPMTPEVVAFMAHTDEPISYDLEERVVVLYVGRM
jgi:hypothetical protein